MLVEVSMKNDEDKFTVREWWARDADFVLGSLRDQLTAASAIWPELKKYAIGTMAENPKPETKPS